jgi:hypothetical protein
MQLSTTLHIKDLRMTKVIAYFVPIIRRGHLKFLYICKIIYRVEIVSFQYDISACHIIFCKTPVCCCFFPIEALPAI